MFKITERWITSLMTHTAAVCDILLDKWQHREYMCRTWTVLFFLLQSVSFCSWAETLNVSLLQPSGLAADRTKVHGCKRPLSMKLSVKLLQKSTDAWSPNCELISYYLKVGQKGCAGAALKTESTHLKHNHRTFQKPWVLLVNFFFPRALKNT